MNCPALDVPVLLVYRHGKECIFRRHHYLCITAGVGWICQNFLILLWVDNRKLSIQLCRGLGYVYILNGNTVWDTFITLNLHPIDLYWLDVWYCLCSILLVSNPKEVPSVAFSILGAWWGIRVETHNKL